MKRWGQLILLCIAVSLPLPVAAEDACESVEIDLAGAEYGLVLDLNNWGQVVGFLGNSAPSALLPFVWQQGETRRLPPLEPGQSATARAINDLGRIVGDSGSSQGYRAVTWVRGEIRALPGTQEASATAINNRGQIAGQSPGGPCLFWEDANSQPVALPGLGDAPCNVTGISETGVVVGLAQTATGLTQGFVWENGRTSNAGPSAERSSHLNDVNAVGLAVGQAQVDTGYGQLPIVRWAGHTRVLPAVGTAQAVNIWGRIAFLSYLPQPDGSHVLLGDARGNVRDAGSLGAEVPSGALLMNDRYQLAWSFSATADGERLPPRFCQLR